MRYCPNCRAKVGTPYEICPICQNEMYLENEVSNTQPEDTEQFPYYPSRGEIRQLSLADKVTLFVIVVICLVCLALDFRFGLKSQLHWSLIVCLWGICLESILRPVLMGRVKPTSYMTHVGFLMACALMLTSAYAGFWKLCMYYIVPILFLVMLLANTVFAIIDRKGDALVYALCNAALGIISVVIMSLFLNTVPLMWNICLLVGLISLIGFCIFMGNAVKTEVHKRLNL